jgi:hypothetical protein
LVLAVLVDVFLVVGDLKARQVSCPMSSQVVFTGLGDNVRCSLRWLVGLRRLAKCDHHR